MLERNVILVLVTGIVAGIAYLVARPEIKRGLESRPRARKVLVHSLPGGYSIVFALTIWFTISDNNDEKREKGVLRQNADSVFSLLNTTRIHLDSNNLILLDVKKEYQKTDSSLQPFLKLALARFPKLDSAKALSRLYGEINIKIQNNINAPNAKIATIGQVGNNYVISNIPDVSVAGNWKFFNKPTDSVGIRHHKEKLPTQLLKFERLYAHQFELTYRSPAMLNRLLMIIHHNSILPHSDVDHAGLVRYTTGVISDPGKYQGLVCVLLTQPEDGKYMITFYSQERIKAQPVLEIVK